MGLLRATRPKTTQIPDAFLLFSSPLFPKKKKNSKRIPFGNRRYVFPLKVLLIRSRYVSKDEEASLIDFEMGSSQKKIYREEIIVSSVDFRFFTSDS